MLGLQTVRDVQSRIDESIRRLGGYWRPLSAVARLSEEIGELSSEIFNPKAQKEKIGAELADIFIITTCLANQYCADLNDEYRHLGLPSRLNQFKNLIPTYHSSQGYFTFIAELAGQIARIVNFYEGDKPLKPDENVPTLASSVALIHKNILLLAKLIDVNLFELVEIVLGRSLLRDASRFGTHFDPTTANSLSRFENIGRQVKCPFAEKAKMWGAPDWDSTLSVASNLEKIIPNILRFASISKHEHLDGFVIEITGADQGNSLESLSETFREVINYLSEHNTCGVNSMKQDIDSPSWQFTFGNERFFIITFAPCYDSNSSRYSYGEDSIFILLQPEHSFDAYHLTEKTRELVRKDFADAGQAYDLKIMSEPLEAPRYVKPLKNNDPIVEWWTNGHSKESSCAK